MTGATSMFTRADHGELPHQLVILTAEGSEWLEHLAQKYQALRTARRITDETDPNKPIVILEDIDTLDVEKLRERLVRTQVAERRGGNFDIVRSDLAEVLLNHIGANSGFQYGYESIRDRETPHLAGRSIDQIGVRLDEEAKSLRLMLGEAKTSSDRPSPPRVVDDNDDSLSKSHAKQLLERQSTAGKILQAYRFSTDAHVQHLFALAAQLFEDAKPGLIIHVTSVLLRPHDLVKASDFGSYATNPKQFDPAVVDFYIVTAEGNTLDELVDEFARLAKVVIDEETR